LIIELVRKLRSLRRAPKVVFRCWVGIRPFLDVLKCPLECGQGHFYFFVLFSSLPFWRRVKTANSPLSSFENSNCSIVPAKAWRRSFVLVPVRCSRFSPVLKAQDALFRLGVLSHPSVVERRVHRRLLLSPPATNSREMRQTRLFGIAQYDDSTGVSRSWREATRRRRRKIVAGTYHRVMSILFWPQSPTPIGVPQNGGSLVGKQMQSDGSSPATPMRCKRILAAIRDSGEPSGKSPGPKTVAPRASLLFLLLNGLPLI